MTATVVRQTILAELAGAESVGANVAQAALLLVVRRLLPEVTLADLVEQLSWLRDRELVAFVSDTWEPESTAARRWTITTKGRAALKQ